ncbi:hypothetical protein AQ490_20245 [Wenjunlia vitaminophila]|uniref:Uncharacterized protein n=1 Tax=Wenjunlia vitaminophila TaxID=76728 RepID=A0A0T6LUH0_WENVI|nr:hypothetical protein [Wenjunlia vitaminophila]KRV49690.1 hypothetical protein AQ490_20245 [Wenjunlia vitaminophila]
MLDVSDEVRAEIGDEEADRLLAGDSAPETYDCTSCRNPGDIARERTSTVLFVGDETAVLAFAHATCVPSQVVTVPEEQLAGAVQSIARRAAGQETGEMPLPPQPKDLGLGAPAGPASDPFGGAVTAPAPAAPSGGTAAPGSLADQVPQQRGVLSITCGLVLCGDTSRPALVVEPSGPVTRPGRPGTTDEFLVMLREHGFAAVKVVDHTPPELSTWSVLLAMGKLHAVLQPEPEGAGQTAWWQAHQPLQVSEEWREIATRTSQVVVYAAPFGTIGHQPREDLMRDALDRAADKGALVGAVLRLTGAPPHAAV